ncbi:hydroxymethylbilane synthase [Saccharopolyspora dendranthemae]|uniref:Porphobilinogen deaminase n=1 Tax=Saccharopolyspora dendranthemae TaxID=1181886 RepID=A0A561U6D0_9PSEU|nr:hydroxymethylbilane synthase [Saccharopolyspora dendranthemae]TWF94915.1 hydroxymethylbilane synthase [Saccharopolyspora dendranthemae]
MNKTLRIGTRGSALAMAQSTWVAEQLEAAGYPTQLVAVETPGDRSSAPIAEIGVGVFTSAVREALVADEVDVAIHSCKDLPTEPDPRLSLAAVPVREDPRDALVARDGLTLGELPPGSVVGTGSPRRASQLRASGLGLEVRGIRGNVDTRMRKVTDGELDAVVLARAGLARVGRLSVITETLDPLQMLPAPAQGALAVECRVDDVDTEHLLQSVLDDQASRAAVAAERAVLARLEAGCHAPVGALAEVVEDLDDDGRVALRLSLRGVVATDDDVLVRASATGETTAAEQLGLELADELLEARAALLSGPGSS